MNNNSEVRIFLVEDHPVMRLGLKMMLEEKGFIVCGEAGNLDEAARLLPESHADVAVFDLSLNGETSFPVIEQIHHRLPNTALIIYSMHDAPLFVDNAMSVGASAYVTKADPVETILDAIKAVRAGKKFMGPTIAKTLEERITGSRGHGTILKDISAREIEVLTALGQGLGRAEIATKLGLSPRTVETYLQRLKQKLGVNQIRELIMEAIRVTHSG